MKNGAKVDSLRIKTQYGNESMSYNNKKDTYVHRDMQGSNICKKLLKLHKEPPENLSHSYNLPSLPLKLCQF